MRRFQILPHTADSRLLIEGNSLNELFLAALDGINSILAPGGCGKTDLFPVTEKIELVAPNTTVLLIDFLSEVISRSYTNRALYCKIIFFQLTPVNLNLRLAGIPIRSFCKDIKAVTYHEANVIKNRQGIYQTTIVLDI